MAGRRRRILDAEERALWHHVTRSVSRLKSAPEAPAPLEPEPAPPPPPAPASIAAPPPPPRRPPPAPALAPLEPKLRRRLSRGQEVDARLDLHGLTQAAAHRRLAGFLIEAQSRGNGVVLVITGKGAGDGPPLSGRSERGVLRRLVPEWLALPELRAIVLGFETAARGHGGDGALYVRIRRRRGDTGGRP
ncbi:MAG TPA: Smr/MutS family protein [Xanthobacteraceae bacterium]|nr:Smr/MutS family protein [Xanthobacteraceae bacterium]